MLPENLVKYVEMHTNSPGPLLKELERYTFLNMLSPNMVSGHFQGKFLQMVSHMVKPKTVLEIGSFTGYSALCLSEGLQENGKVYTIEVNPELESTIRKFISKAGKEEQIELHIGDAFEIIPKIGQQYDLIFLDANKEHYQKYLDLVYPLLNKGGYLLADNVLWHGRVLKDKMAKDAVKIDHFNKAVFDHPGLDTILLPLRDGMTLARKL